jgi:heptosyltransferase-2
MFYIIYQTAFIGDIILLTSMVRSIKEVDSSGEIIVVTTPLGKEILAHNGDITEVLVFDKRNSDRGYRGLKSIIARIKEIIRSEDSVFISPHRFMRASLIGFMIGSRIRVGFKRSALSFLYNLLVPYRMGIHEIERNHELLIAHFGEAMSRSVPEMPRLFPAEDSYKRVRELICASFRTADKLVAIAPGSIWPTKRWPLEYYGELMGLLGDRGIRVILIGGEGDRGICSRLESEIALNLAGKLTVLESAAAISTAGVIVTNDSAPLHIASAMNIPTVAIFGATTPYLGFGPLADRSIIVENGDVRCRPCGRHGGKSCRYNHLDCMRGIKPEAVFSRVMEIFA